MSSHRKSAFDEDSSSSISVKRHHPNFHSPSTRPSFPSHLETPNLPSKIRFLCEIIASSPSIESSLNDSEIRISSDDVEEVLKLSYSHPAAAVKFFRWCGPRLHHNHSPYSWNLVVDLLGKNILFDAMWDVVASMKAEGIVSLATFASIFSSFAAANRPSDAISAFESLPLHEIAQGITALNSLLSALSREGLTSSALDYFRQIRLRIRPDSDSYAILLEGFENERDYRSAREVFDDMILQVGWDPSNVSAYESFLSTVLLHGVGGLDESLSWMAEMKGQRCFPGPKFISRAVDECVKLGEVRTTTFLWDSFTGRNGFLPTTELYNSMITLHCNLNHLDAAFQMFDDMVFFGAFPDSKTYSLMLQILIKSKKLEEVCVFLSEMVKNEHVPSSAICDSAMYLLMDSRDWDAALKVWKIMNEKGIAGEEIGNTLIQRLSYYKRLPEACKYAEEMIDKGIKLQSSTLSKLKSSLQQAGKGALYDNILIKWKKYPTTQILLA